MSSSRVESLAKSHYRAQSRLAARAVRIVLHLWNRTDPDLISQSWDVNAAVRAVSAAQVAASRNAGIYVLRSSEAQQLDPPSSVIDPAAFVTAGLSSLMQLPAITAKLRIADGVPATEAMRAGRYQAGLLAGNEVQRVGRESAGVGITANPQLGGYYRMLHRPSCPRCVILAGRFYRYSSGFRRHPRCDCVHVPAADAEGLSDLRTDPRAYFDSLSREAQDKTFGKGGAEAIREGADISQVVNVNRKGALEKIDGRMTTREGTNTRQGMAGRRLARIDGQLTNPDGSIRVPDVFERSRARLTPTQIYREATSRTDAIRLLHEYGYLQPTPVRRSYRELYRDLGGDARGFVNGVAPTLP